MRFSRSNTFYGPPVGPDVVMQWGPTVLQNLGADAFTGGQPAWFMSQGPDQTLWYVEVTPDDYRMLTPRETTTEDDDSEDERGPVNTHGLTDNCYYCTAAALANTTTEDLIRRTEEMQIAGGSPLPGIVSLFRTAGLSSTYQSYTSFENAERGMVELAAGLDKTFGFAYERSGGAGHMIVATYDATDQEFTYHDHQSDTDGHDDASRGSAFHVFPQ